MFRKISSGETTDLDALFEKLQFHSPAAFLLCLDQKFSIPTSIENLPMKRLSTHLSHFSTYVHLLRDILTSNSCCSESTVQKLFGLKQSNFQFLVPKHTALFAAAAPFVVDKKDSDPNPVKINKTTLEALVKKVVGQRLKSRIITENELCSQANFLTSGVAGKGTRKVSFQEIFRGQVRVCLQQICIYHCMNALPKELKNSPELQQHQRCIESQKIHTVLYHSLFR